MFKWWICTFLSFIPQSFSPGRGQTSVFRRPCERSCQSGIPVKKAGLRPPGKVASYEPDSILIRHCSRVWQYTTELCPHFILPQGRSSPRPSPSCPARARHGIVRPAVKPPPVPAYAAQQKEQKAQPQIQPVTSPQRQCSAQAYTLPPFKSEQRRGQAPPPPSGPPPLPSQGTKTHSQHSAGPNSRPDPPSRPPPPCPVNKPSLVIFSFVCFR